MKKIENYSNDYVIYPNPTRNNSFINLINESSKPISSIELYDLNRIKQKVDFYKSVEKNYKIEASNLYSGVYIMYVIFSDGFYKSTKLVVRK